MDKYRVVDYEPADKGSWVDSAFIHNQHGTFTNQVLNEFAPLSDWRNYHKQFTHLVGTNVDSDTPFPPRPPQPDYHSFQHQHHHHHHHYDPHQDYYYSKRRAVEKDYPSEWWQKRGPATSVTQNNGLGGGGRGGGADPPESPVRQTYQDPPPPPPPPPPSPQAPRVPLSSSTPFEPLPSPASQFSLDPNTERPKVSPLTPVYYPRPRPTYPPRPPPTPRPAPFTTTYSPGPRVPLVPEVGDRQVVPLVSGRITLQSGKWGLNRVNFPKTHASTENELAPMLENRFKKHAGGYAPFKKGDYDKGKETALDPTEWYEIRPSWE